jgi:hypothetical protein
MSSVASSEGFDSLDYRHDSTIILQGSASTTMTTESILLEVEFQGLVTGDRLNRVRLDSLVLTGSLPSTPARSDGMIGLEGFEIGRNDYLIPKSSLTKVSFDPLSTLLTVRYVAPEESAPGIQLIDMSGGRRLLIELPEGTGREQEVAIPAGDLTMGIYVVRMRAGEEVVVQPVMIAR